jgi:predicted phosphodiesterase
MRAPRLPGGENQLIYITGDLHGDLARFKSKAMRKLKKNDTLIVLGDFGFLWEGGKAEAKRLKWIGKRKYQVLFVEGTHDNLDLLGQYPQSEWCGGQTRLISGKLRHLCRGGVFTIEGQSIFAFGGGDSADADVRDNWWSRELPSQEEIAETRERLASRSWAVDYIVTHQCSRKLKTFLALGQDEVNVMDAFFDEIRESCQYTRWFFGSYHINKIIPPGEMAVYDAVVPVVELKK